MSHLPHSDIPCGIIQDLLILYEDDVCGAESRELIERHIAGCENCRKIYENTGVPLPAVTLGDEDGSRKRFVRSLKRIMNAYRIIAIVAAVLAAALWADWFRTSDLFFTLTTIPARYISVTELYELHNGDIYCTLESRRDFSATSLSGVLTPPFGKRETGTSYLEGPEEISFRFSPPFGSSEQLSQVSFIIPREGSFTYYERTDDGPEVERSCRSVCTSIRYHGRGEDDRLAVWGSGQRIEPAPAAIEEKARDEYARNLIDPHTKDYSPLVFGQETR